MLMYAPVAQLDSASDSDVSGRSSWEAAQVLAASGKEPTEGEKSFAVDDYLTTIFKKAVTSRKGGHPHMRP